MSNPSLSDSLARDSKRLQQNISSNLEHLIDRLQTAKDRIDQGDVSQFVFYGETFARGLAAILIDSGKLKGLQDVANSLTQDS